MSQVKVTFKKAPYLGKLVLVPDNGKTGLQACDKCELYSRNNGTDKPCHTIHTYHCGTNHWQKAKP